MRPATIVACRSSATRRSASVGRLGRLEIGVERRLDVDDEIARLGQVNDHVGPNGAVLRRLMALGHEVAVLDHARELDEPAQRDLAPLAANLGPAQRAHEVARLGAQRLLARRERFELLADAAVRLAARLVELLHLALGARERFADRRDEAVDRLLARGQIALRALGVHAQGLARELEKRLGVTLKLPVRELIESRAEPLGGERRALRSRSRSAAARLRSSASLRASFARQRHRAPEPDQQPDREPADGGQRDVEPYARRHLAGARRARRRRSN